MHEGSLFQLSDSIARHDNGFEQICHEGMSKHSVCFLFFHVAIVRILDSDKPMHACNVQSRCLSHLTTAL